MKTVIEKYNKTTEFFRNEKLYSISTNSFNNDDNIVLAAATGPMTKTLREFSSIPTIGQRYMTLLVDIVDLSKRSNPRFRLNDIFLHMYIFDNPFEYSGTDNIGNTILSIDNEQIEFPENVHNWTKTVRAVALFESKEDLESALATLILKFPEVTFRNKTISTNS